MLVAIAITLMIQLSSYTATQNVNNKQKGEVIGATGGAILDKLSDVLNEYADTNISVVGHTDSSGSDT